MKHAVAIIRQLSVPLNYLRVRGKLFVDVWLPLLFALVTGVLLLSLRAAITTEHGLVAQVNNLLQVLVGFYVASLAALATFPNPSLDQAVKGSVFAGHTLTRRRMLSFLFGYLAFVSVFVYIGGSLAMLLATPLHTLALSFPWLRSLLVIFYAAVCGNLLCVTLLGLYYLIEKIYQPDPVQTHVAPARGHDEH